ncbi:MAG: hypothetical protein ACLS9Y_10725 [Ruthenibacterium lactatiformans]
MTQHEAQLNGFLVNVFNDILRLEEASIRKGPCKNLSVSEMHVLEAVEKSSVDASAQRAWRRCRTSFHHLRHAECGCQNAGAEGYLVRSAAAGTSAA